MNQAAEPAKKPDAAAEKPPPTNWLWCLTELARSSTCFAKPQSVLSTLFYQPSLLSGVILVLLVKFSLASVVLLINESKKRVNVNTVFWRKKKKKVGFF